MKEIKFRAWDISNKLMYTHEQLLDDNEVNPGVLTDCLIADGTGYDTDTILLQYTGLKDKNGTEIYEGDILGDTFAVEGMGVKTTVQWDDGYSGFRPWAAHVAIGKDSSQVPFNNPDKYTEVIGNIYENPELTN